MRPGSLVLIFCLFSAAVTAAPWIGNEDESLHHDLRVLVDHQLINAVAVTFPVPWQGIGPQLQALDIAALPAAAQPSALRLLEAYRQHQSAQAVPVQMTRLYAATEPSRFPGLAIEQGQSARLSHQVEYQSGHWAGQLKGNLASGGDSYLDGSYLAFSAAGWSLRAGAVDQFWGPAHGSSLILSTNARPVPTVGIFRNAATQSDSAWLSWLGPWYASAEVGQFESHRGVPDAKLWRTRFTFKPVTGLSVGLSWAAMWGGEGQPASWGDFWDMLTFQTQCIDGLASCDPELETTIGNHIAGFDLAYTLNAFGRPWSVYLQRVGEDAVDGYRVTDNANLYGLSTFIGPLRLYLEHSDTNVACNGDGNTATNCYYEHSTYTSGYRYYGRAVGSTFDSDAKQTTLGARWHGDAGQTAVVSLSAVELNPDGQRPSPALMDSASEDLWYLQGYYQRPVDNWVMKLGASAWQSDRPEGDKSEVTVYLDVRYQWGREGH